MKQLASLVVVVMLVHQGACRSSKPGGSRAAVGASAQGDAADMKAKRASSSASAVPSSEPPPAPPGPPPLAGAEFEALAVEGFGEAVVSRPLGADSPRPIVVALHGNYDRPEWQCQVWRGITGGFPWVLCPRGVPRQDAPRGSDRWTFAGLPRFEKELEAGLAALQAAQGPYVDPKEPIFTGFSLGAILGVHLLKKPDSPYRRAVLIEGGYKGWGVAGARAFADHGGKRLLFGCGQTACMHAGKQVERLFAKGPVEVEVVSGGNIGHTYDGTVAEAVRAQWNWLVAGDSRFPGGGKADLPENAAP